MLSTLFLTCLLLLAVLGAGVSLLIGLGGFLFHLFSKKKKKTRMKRFLILLLVGIVLLAVNPLARQLADSTVQSIFEGDSGAYWLEFNAPGSGFSWNGTRFLAVKGGVLPQEQINDDEKEGIRVGQPPDSGGILSLLHSDWIYPVENDRGFELYHHFEILYCPEYQWDEVSDYYQNPEHWETLH